MCPAAGTVQAQGHSPGKGAAVSHSTDTQSSREKLDRPRNPGGAPTWSLCIDCVVVLFLWLLGNGRVLSKSTNIMKALVTNFNFPLAMLVQCTFPPTV